MLCQLTMLMQTHAIGLSDYRQWADAIDIGASIALYKEREKQELRDTLRDSRLQALVEKMSAH